MEVGRKVTKINGSKKKKGWVTCPCMFMMTTVLERLQTTNCSTLRGSGWMLCTVMSVPARPPRDLNVFRHSVLFMFHTFIVPSELALVCHNYTTQLATYVC